MLTGWGGPVTGSEAPRDHQHGTASWWPREAATSQTESVFTPYVGGRVTLTGCWGTGWAGGAGACTRRGDCPPRLPPQASGSRSSMPGGREASTGTARPPGPAGTSHECADRGRPVGSRGAWRQGQNTPGRALRPAGENGTAHPGGLPLLPRRPPRVDPASLALKLLSEGIQDLIKVFRLSGPWNISEQNVISSDVSTVKSGEKCQFLDIDLFSSYRGDACGYSVALGAHRLTHTSYKPPPRETLGAPQAHRRRPPPSMV